MPEIMDEIYLRILSHGTTDPDDNEACAYLIDKGYADGRVERSRLRANYNQVKRVVWLGLTANGIEYREKLKGSIDPLHDHNCNDVTNNDIEEKQPNIQRQDSTNNLPLSQKPLGIISIMIVGGTLTAFVVYLFGKQLGISL